MLQVILGASQREMERVHGRLKAGKFSSTPGLLEQWLKEERISREQAVIEAANMFGAGIDSVR